MTPIPTARRAAVLALVLCASLTGSVSATQLEVLRYFSIATVQPLIDYCRQTAPERMTDVQRGFDNYVLRLDDALRGRLPATGIPDALTPQLTNEAQAAGAKLVQSIRHVDPSTYCAWLASRLQMTTRDMMVEGLDQFDRQFDAQRNAPPPPAPKQ